MKPMTTHERMTRMFAHREADRVPITDIAWESTLWRWRREGLPADVPWDQFFGLDRLLTIQMDTSPRFEAKILEETDTYRIVRDNWGVTKKDFKPSNSTPQDLAFKIHDRKTWEAAKPRFAVSRDRIDWEGLAKSYGQWRRDGSWIQIAPWFGYDIVNARTCGTETILVAMAEDPEWVKDMCDTGCDLTLSLADMLWDAGYTFDEFMWWDDMAYRNGMLFSKEMWREIVRPYQKRVIDWAHAHGIKAHLHCCGDIRALIPDLLDLGLDALNPLEVKAGMDPIGTKQRFGDRLLLKGGFDVMHWDDPARAEADIRAMLPAMMKNGGYLFASDHSIPQSVSLAAYRRIVDCAREVGTYR